jgi:uncharacterized membrane protein (UPF0136 family)
MEALIGGALLFVAGYLTHMARMQGWIDRIKAER